MIKLSVKILITTILTMLLFLCIPNYRTDSDNSIKEIDDMTNYQSDSFYPLIEQFVYYLSEDITIPFIIDSNSDVISFGYESIGFSVVEEPYISNRKAFVTIKNDNLQLNLMFILKVNLANGEQLASQIYGIVEDNYIYINTNSYEAAKDIYLSEKLNNNSITEKEYELIMMQNNNCFAVNNVLNDTFAGPTRSSSGGWVSGSLRWQDDWGNWHPLQHTKVSIFDEDPISDDNMGTVYTDENGEYVFSFDDNRDDLLDSSGWDIYIKVWPAGINSVVKTGSNNEYVIRTVTNWDVTTGSITPINVDIYMNSDLGRAFQVSQAIITCANYASTMNGTSMANVTVRYPHNESSNSCFYRKSNDTVYIIGNRTNDTRVISGQILHSYASWDVIMHEYGHFVQDKLNIGDSPGGTHWPIVNMYDHYMSHYSGGPITPDCDGNCANPSASNAKDSAIKIAYAESWPSILGAMAQQYYINLGELDSNIVTVGDDQFASYNGATSDYNDGLQSGEAVESAVMGVLWDVYDNDIELYDSISLDHADWWNLTVGGSPKTLSEVTNRFYSLYSSYTMWDPFDKLLEYYKMSPDNINISGTIMSYLAPTITWMPNGTSSSLLNNSFRVMIYNSSFSLVVDYYTTNTSITLSQEQWNSVISSGGDKLYITIGGSQTNGTSTGYYYSALKEFSKPIVQTALENGTIKITGYYDWTPSSLTIQTSYNGLPTTIIEESAFYGCTSLESITIPNSVESIKNYAFEYCSSLEDVTILRWQAPITNLGLNAFDNCASNLSITVPTNRVCEYKNAPFWSSYRDKIVPSSPIVNHIYLDCSIDDDRQSYLSTGYNKLYRLDVECDGWYTISCTSGTHYSIYNSNMVKIDGSYGTYELTLNEGTYYIDIEWEDPTDSGYATLHFLNKGINVSDNITNNILPHLHQVGLNDYKAQLKYYNNQGPGFYNISVNAASINPITYNEGTITFYSNYSRTTIINKYSDDNYTLSAKSSLGANNMVMYFPSNGYYYFDVILNTNDLTALTLNINPLTSTNLNLFDLSTSTDEGVELLSNDIKGDYFKKVLLKQSGKFEITGEYKDYSSENAYVLVARIVPSGSSNTLDVKLISVINDNIISASSTCNLEPGTYYIGYFNNIEGVEIGISFERKITQYGSYNLISDPNSFEDYGSEVRFNNGSYLGSTLTVGFTRFIYLNYDYILPSYSRLDYYFYSSNESVATISEYGTLLGKSAGTVKIMAVYKSDPSITFVKQFTILADNRVNNLIIYDTDSIDYTGSGQIYQIELDDYNSYFPQISLYNWTLISSSNNYSYSISEWGTFSLYGTDIIVIEGTSQLNSKLRIRITITVTN